MLSEAVFIVKSVNACFCSYKSCDIIRYCPQNRGQDGGNAPPCPNPQGAAVVEPSKRNRFYSLKGRVE